jgi:hypothetical protein
MGSTSLQDLMTTHRNQDRWLKDIAERQRNIVFPDTMRNSSRFWQNLGPPSATSWIGLLILGVFYFTLLAAFLCIIFRSGKLLSFILATLLIGGPIFGGIAWATRRTLGNLQNAGRSQKRLPRE